ncbi:class I SAM-dependent methyltransferase [Vineibacter terrae]|uniref:Class I SAM-dependent methyltransferase n=1 Tax=Vineibacter terrae TaxID=2586908 RepID=A0A5C8PE90_9HYPH|nr:class I SAM-dependent methyltransferase [Vineibacter terrae]TXL72067.1 class I SAM-dependent methyltransferase [Vineibacter terrae]
MIAQSTKPRRGAAAKDRKTALARTVPQRLIWATERLDIAPTDRLLEIGCGPGVTVSLICDRLTHGTITAIDRSSTAIAAAKARNRDHIASGRAAFQATELAAARFESASFNKAFAVNVNLFWIDAARELAVIGDALTADGTLTLVYQPPAAKQRHAISRKLALALEANGFVVAEVRSTAPGAPPLLGVTARITPARRCPAPAAKATLRRGRI